MNTTQQHVELSPFERLLDSERPRLLRLCTRLTGDSTSAEDMVQEALLEAWRNRHKLYDFEGAPKWLSSITRMVYLRWARNQSKEPTFSLATPAVCEHEALVDGGEQLERAVEQDELSELLQRAIASLPAETQAVLVGRYLEERPQAEVAAQLGMNENALAVRLHRGKQSLYRILTNEFHDELVSYDEALTASESWQQTSLWCWNCGQHHLLGLLSPTRHEFALRCPACDREPDCYTMDHVVRYADRAHLFTERLSFRQTVIRLNTWAREYYQRGLRDREVECLKCGRLATLHMGLPDYAPHLARERYGVRVECECHPINHHALSEFARCSPEGTQFSRRHPRMRTLPVSEIEMDGRPVLVQRFESITDTGWLDALFVRDTFEAIGSHVHES